MKQDMQNNADKKQLRSFGLTVGSIFAVIAIWPVIVRDDGLRWWAVLTGGLLIVLGLIFPRSLSSVYKLWMSFGHIMGWINTRVILGVVFYFVVTPIGMIRRLLGKDPMGKEFKPDFVSYRIPRTARPPSHLKRQY
jgi:Saxitoxin biosynthesis operon protein SxtJ